MAATLRQLEAQAHAAGRRSEAWQDVLASMTSDIEAVARHNPAKRRRTRQRLMGIALKANAASRPNDWFADDARERYS